MNALERDIKLLGDIIAVQSSINDILTQCIIKMHEDKIKITSLGQQFKIGEPIPMVLLELFNMSTLATPVALKHSNLISSNIKSDEIDVRILIPTLNPSSVIMRADPFRYRAVHEEQLCDFMYVGPEYVLFNATSKCVRPLSPDEIINDRVIGKGCRKNKALDGATLYESRHCRKMENKNMTRPAIQMKHDGQRLRINCQEHMIIINASKQGCPNYIFSLEKDETFTIDDYTYIYSKINVTDYYSMEIPERINIHLGIAKTEFKALEASDIEQLEKEGKELNNTIMEESVVSTTG